MSDDPPWGSHAFTATDLHALPAEYPYEGATSFLRRPWRRELDGLDVAVAGIPFDLATTHRPGARFGPRAVRQISGTLAWEKRVYGFDFHPVERLAIADIGDFRFDFQRPAGVPAQIEQAARRVVDAGVTLLALGGDHFVSYPLLRATAARHGPLSLLHFDAHTDTWPSPSEDGISHGTMFWHAAREGVVDPARSVQVGIRTTNLDTLGFNILDAPSVHAGGVDATVAGIRRILGDRPVYLTFDIDCLDPAYAPGTGTPVMGGLTAAQALAIVQGLRGLDVVGADLVEVAPAYDVGEVTALAGATLALNFLCLFALSPRRAGRPAGDATGAAAPP